MKKRIMFVDDDANILNGLKRTLRSQREEWEMAFVQSGAAALELAEQEYFDAVVSDMRMPGMDGAQLLNQIKERYPHVVRIILSGQSNQEMVMKSVGPTHQFLSKPCDIQSLKATLSRTFALRSLLTDDRLKALVSSMVSLPSLPDLYLRVINQLQDPEISVKEVADTIADDQAMTLKILQLVNSAFFGLGRHISSPHNAAALLGLDTLKSLTLSIGIFSQYDQEKLKSGSFSLDALQRHCSSVAVSAKRIASLEETDRLTQEDSFLAGMLHDIGKLILAVNLPEEYTQLQERQHADTRESVQSEQELFGTTHANVGAYLLGLWGLPQSVVEAVAFHHHPEQLEHDSFSPLTAVHVANALNRPPGAERASVSDSYLANLGLSEKLATWEAAAIDDDGDATEN